MEINQIIHTDEITLQASVAVNELLAQAKAKPGDIIVIGCSTSEVCGHIIGTGSSTEAAAAIMDGVLPVIKDSGLYLAVQCCEHLNRCLVVEEECAEKYGFSRVNVIPQLHAGGAFSMEARKRFSCPVMVENIGGKAALGMDIGDTFIGMHMRPVVVPIHTEHRNIGAAHLAMARTRYKFVGGDRAVYDPELK